MSKEGISMKKKGRRPSPNKTAASKKKASKPKKLMAADRTSTSGRSEATNRRRKPQRSRISDSASDSAGQSGDLQGLSNVEDVDSESVDELLEEGNAFEAGIVSGIEDSQNREGKEVRTREVPEDDVPQEYLDED
jgi:hypothetical protein